jgi:hypothetical protein
MTFSLLAAFGTYSCVVTTTLGGNVEDSPGGVVPSTLGVAKKHDDRITSPDFYGFYGRI